MLASIVISRTRQRKINLGGFTLVELVGTLVILSTLAFVALPRFFDRSSFDARIFDDRAQSMLQHAKKIAIAQNRNVYVLLDGTRFAFCFKEDCTDKVIAPTGSNSGSAVTFDKCGGSANASWMCEGIPSGITYAITPATTGFFFNALGKPFNLVDTPPASSFTTPLDISLAAGGATHHLVVEPETGYVHP